MFVLKSDASIKVYEQQNAINKDWTLERYFLPKEYVLTKLKAFEVHGGDIIVSCAGTIGEIYEIPENAECGVINQALMRVRVNEKIIDKKLFIIVFSNMIDDFTRTHSNGSAIKNIPPFADLKPMEVLIPPIKEQKKISEYFENLDHLITLHQRKSLSAICDIIESNLIFKSAITYSWEQRKVSELFKVTRGYVLAATLTEPTKTDEKPYPVYSSQTKDKGLMGYYKDYLYEDAITWTTDGANAGTVNYRAGKFYCTNVCGVLLSNEVTANQMIAEALNNVAKGYVSYVGNPKLMNNVMANIEIMIPTQAEERDKMSEFFCNLDHLITLHQRKSQKFLNVNSAWEQRKVSELFKVTRGYVLAATLTEPTKTDEKPYPVYSSQTKDKGLMGYYKDYLYEDAITWTTDGANAGTVNYRAGKFYCTNVCGVLLSNEVTANQMIAEALNNVAKGYVSYVGNPKLMNNVMANIEIMIPTQAEERDKMSEFFCNLDHLITLHRRAPPNIERSTYIWIQPKSTLYCSVIIMNNG